MDDDLAAPLRSRFFAALRWIAVLPVAVAAGWLAWFLVNLLNRISLMWAGMNPDSLLGRAFIEAASAVAMGAGSVYAGAKVAPAYKHIVVFVLAGLSLLLAGLCLFPALLTGSGWAIYSTAWWIAGAGGVAWAVYSGEAADLQ